MSDNKYKSHNSTEFIFSNEFINYTVIPNYIFNSKTLSYRAIGIYCSILQFQNSPEHVITVRGLASSHKEGRDAVCTALNELIEAGFIERICARDKGQYDGTLYKVYMKPHGAQGTPPRPEKPDTDNPNPKNPSHKKKISKKENRKKENTSSSNTHTNTKDFDRKKYIESQTHLKLTPYQIKITKNWDEQKLKDGVEIFKINEGETFALLLKIYREGAKKWEKTSPHHPAASRSANSGSSVSVKVQKFNAMASHDFDLDHLEVLEEEHLKETLQKENAKRLAEGKPTLDSVY